MATFLDISILSHFTSVFTFLLVFIIVFGMLEFMKIFGESKKGWHSIIALSIGIMVILSSGVTKVIQTFTPWFMIIVFLIFFILFAVRMFGIGEKDITSAFKSSSILSWIIILTLVIMIYSFSQAFGQESLEKTSATKVNVTTTMVNGTAVVTGTQTNTNDFMQNLYNTFYHPKVLGLVLIMLIGVIAMLFLTVKEDG